ncbi:MAG: hypothetical protein LBK77_04470 [Spirochaetaceae bacterium]|jgi:hypothetical protein|nr:hypothetical protein [Spirochaetaceae bacterium]
MGAGTFFSTLLEKGKDLFFRLAEQAAARRRVVLIAAAGLLVIILLLLILAVVTSRKARDAGNTEASAGLPESRAFLPEDFFLPYEPDFVPDVLLEREPRNGWTEEDARPFWTDPLNGNEEAWRERIESGVDAILERVP